MRRPPRRSLQKLLDCGSGVPFYSAMEQENALDNALMEIDALESLLVGAISGKPLRGGAEAIILRQFDIVAGELEAQPVSAEQQRLTRYHRALAAAFDTFRHDRNGEDQGLIQASIGDGVPPLLLTAVGLMLAGGFAMFLAAGGEFLPHDVRYLDMSAAELCSVAECRIVDFMIHDRAAFGGALFGVGVLYAYLGLFPVRRGEAWAWWLMLFSGTLGFASFLTYFVYGYRDAWHGVGTLLLLTVYTLGMVRSRRIIRPWRGPLVVLTAGTFPDLRTHIGLGRACLLLGAGGTAIGGLVILQVGLTGIFVPTDLSFIGLTADDLRTMNPRLLPLIAHDRVGFGAAVFIIAVTALTCIWCNPITPALWQTLCISGTVSLAAAIGTHLDVGYTDLGHLAPPFAASVSMIVGLVLTFPYHHAGIPPVGAS